MALLPHSMVSILIGLASILYVILGMFVLFHPGIRKAGKVGFSLW